MCDHKNGSETCRDNGYCYDGNIQIGPCPACNTLVYLQAAKAAAESTGYYESETDNGTGVELWEKAVKFARKANPTQFNSILTSIGRVNALYVNDPSTSSDELLVKTFVYGEEKSRDEINKLKESWFRDACWDIEDTEGFSLYYDELLAFRKQCEQEWEAEYAMRKAKEEASLHAELEKIGTIGLLRQIKWLEERLDQALERIHKLESQSK